MTGVPMASKSPAIPPGLVEVRPGLGILRLAALFADGEGDADDESLDAMFELMEAGVLEITPPAEMWPELACGLMAPAPARMIAALRESGALSVLLPEVDGLFGVPEISDNSEPVDLGQHLLDVLTEAAACEAPLEVRFALLVMNVGKVDSPREHLPVHYRHVERGGPRIAEICDRFGVPERCRELALLALVECERVHRVSEIRAGPIALMLERLHAFDDLACFDRLLSVCRCDYRAHGSRSGKDYPKAALLDRALRACADLDMPSPSDEAGALDSLRAARAASIAVALRSERWSGD